MINKEKLLTAKEWIGKLANGINPLNDELRESRESRDGFLDLRDRNIDPKVRAFVMFMRLQE